ncbi:site-2 protease family protein [Fodinisporobacter ferrooxydans]|uniref:Site-2 protease family protein n=1 Tax=Fodinisporobacter ferrooxydans TaxID=2901836 RepID=A0ABY4CHW1_9BACL|nr:site-2 protease family protein [Alicyclobacillaceae bacterium MYW30-H2]
MLQSFSSGMFVFQLLAFLVAIIFHELAHGYVAYRLGDPTAKNQGRLTLNPISHIDPIGLLLILFGPFGWAKPVPINPQHFKNKRVGIALVSVAGPLANFLIAILAGLLLKLYLPVYEWNSSPVYAFVFNLLTYMLWMNVMLCVFNLIPIPPLDGSKILFSFVPRQYLKQMYVLEQYGPFLLLLVLITPLNHFLYPLISGGTQLVQSIVGLKI